jgi:DNA-binding CsgD family transcriptional regulator
MKMGRVSLEELSSVIAVIHAAAASPDRWPEALSAVELLLKRVDEPSSRNGGRERHESSGRSLKRLAALLAPHLETARRVQSQLSETLPAQVALASLDQLAAAALVSDRFGTVRLRNACAESMLSEKDLAHIANSKISFRDSTLNKQFFEGLRTATQENPRSTVLAFQRRPKEICEVAVSPLPGAPKIYGSVPLALVVIATPHTDADRVVTRVRHLYCLTETEARVMAALALGGSVKQIANAHGVCVSTVRAQVRSIFEKAAVHRQTDLVRLALTGAPIILRDGK